MKLATPQKFTPLEIAHSDGQSIAHGENPGQRKSLTGFSFKALVAVLVLGMVVLGAVFFLAKQRAQKSQQEQALPLSEEEKKKILESLSAPPGASQYTDEEKRQILKSLSTPKSSGPALSDDEKRAILESLSVPNQ